MKSIEFAVAKWNLYSKIQRFTLEKSIYVKISCYFLPLRQYHYPLGPFPCTETCVAAVVAVLQGNWWDTNKKKSNPINTLGKLLTVAKNLGGNDCDIKGDTLVLNNRFFEMTYQVTFCNE